MPRASLPARRSLLWQALLGFACGDSNVRSLLEALTVEPPYELHLVGKHIWFLPPIVPTDPEIGRKFFETAVLTGLLQSRILMPCRLSTQRADYCLEGGGRGSTTMQKQARADQNPSATKLSQ